MPGLASNFQQVWADGDNAIYYAGAPSADWEHNALMRYANGQWEALDSLDGLINTAVVYRDTLVVGGGFDYSGVTSHGVKYYDGTGWQTFATIQGAGGADVRRLKVLHDTLYAVGTFDMIEGHPANGVAKRVGGTWVGVGEFPNADQVIVDIVEYHDTLVCIGYVTFTTGRGIAYLAPGATQWQLLGPGILGGMSGAHTLAVYQDQLYVGGQISLPAGNAGQEIMRWNGHAFEGLGSGLQFSEGNFSSFCDVRGMVEHDGLLFVGGGCNVAGGLVSHGVAIWDGSRWCSVPGHPNDQEGVVGMDFYRDTLFITTGHIADGDSVNLAAKFIGSSYIDSCGSAVGIVEQWTAPNEIRAWQGDDGMLFITGLLTGVYPVDVCDVQGRMVVSTSVQGNGNIPVPISGTRGLATGIYVIRSDREGKRPRMKVFISDR